MSQLQPESQEEADFYGEQPTPMDWKDMLYELSGGADDYGRCMVDVEKAIPFIQQTIDHSVTIAVEEIIKIAEEYDKIADDEEKSGWTKHCSCLKCVLDKQRQSLKLLVKQSK